MAWIRYEALLVTGAAGFVGRHLLRFLQQVSEGPERIIALDVRAVGVPDCGDRVLWVKSDLTEYQEVRKVLKEIQPDGIIHLAGVTSSDDLRTYFAANVQACEHILSTASELPDRPRVLVVGSAAQYGITSGEHEIVEESRPLLGGTPYAVSKTLQEKWALLYGRFESLPVICARPFNIIGPGQPAHLVPATFLHQVADVLNGRAKEVCVGDTSACRDFTDVRDVAAGLWALMNADDSANGQKFNIASGQPVRIADVLDSCIELGGREIPVRQDTGRLRALDVPIIVGDSSRLCRMTGWRCRIPWRQSLLDMWQEVFTQ